MVWVAIIILALVIFLLAAAVLALVGGHVVLKRRIEVLEKLYGEDAWDLHPEDHSSAITEPEAHAN